MALLTQTSTFVVEPRDVVTVAEAQVLLLVLVVLTLDTLVGAFPPAAVTAALRVTHTTLCHTSDIGLVIQAAVFLGGVVKQKFPVNVVHVAEVLVPDDCHFPVADAFEGRQLQRSQRCREDVQSLSFPETKGKYFLILLKPYGERK